MGIVAKYKFDGSVYADLIPEFNPEFTNYTITDEVDSENSNHIIRTIESDSLPTLIYFGLHNSSNVVTDRVASLLSIEYLDVSQCTNLAQLCRYCYNLESVNCGDWDTRNVDSMLWLFEGCNKLKEVDVRNWDTSKCTQIGAIFSGCTSLTSIDLSLWDTNKVINLMYLFATCNSLVTLDISNMVILEGNSLEGFIRGCTSLKYIKCNIPNTIQKISSKLLTRTSDNPGVIIYQGTETLPQETIDTLNSIGWTVVTNPTLIAKYKYDSTIYKNLIPEFNEGYMGFVEDEEIDANGVVTRKIEHVELPTLMRFGVTAEISGSGTEREKSLMEIIELDTSNLTTAHSMFRACLNLSILHGINTWNVSKVINMASMFGGGCGITSLDLSNWDTSNVITFDSMFSNDRLLTTLKLFKVHSSCVNIYNMFLNCNNLITLDLSSWDTESIEYYNAIFKGLFNLSSLDISNFSIKNTASVTDMFTNTFSLTDIGMIYCDQSTINKVASLLPTDHNITIWVESDDILQYDQYDHITYKTQKVQDTVHLNSPLLKGDTIEVIDGKTYHVHRWAKVVLNSSENWSCYANGDITSVFCLKTWKGKLVDGIDLYCDKFPSRFSSWNVDSRREGVQVDADIALTIQIDNSKLSTLDVNGFKQWLSENPTTVVYELTTPYYELISGESLELTLLDTTDNTINNNSILPSNMSIANKELSTIAIKPSTTYTLSFDKSNVDSEVTIDICGGEQITTVLNRIELTTPSELGSGIRFISSDGCIISNVRLLKGSLVKEAIPKETFEGLKNSFEDGYIIGDNLIDVNIGTASNGAIVEVINNSTVKVQTGVNTQGMFNITLSNLGLESNKVYTFIVDTTTNWDNDTTTNNSFLSYGLYNNITTTYYNKNYYSCKDIFKFSTKDLDLSQIRLIIYTNKSSLDNYTLANIIVLEGDHIHLSEAELMRYIEKGTSHYEEEDYNHVGKYKVEYKVTGKNKFDKNKELQAISYRFSSQNHNVDFNDDYIRVKYGLYGDNIVLGDIGSFKKGTYTISCECYLETLALSNINIGYFVNNNWNHRQVYKINFNTWEKFTYTFTLENDTDSLYLQFQATGSAAKYFDLDFRVRNIQIEEGTVATEYEPYKEDIRTYYLSSPLLEGDTIEDVNGVATHVKRYEKVVLDGGSDENWVATKTWDDNVLNNTTYLFNMMDKNRIPICDIKIAPFSDKFIGICSESMWGITITSDYEFIQVYADGNVYIRILQNKINGYTTEAMKAWLSENPTTLVYKLRTPIYEPISTESILLDSYTNGHLDLSNENIPIEKVKFINWYDNLKYLQSNTRYTVRFESDNDGKLDTLGVGGTYLYNQNVVKGLNEFILTTNNTPTTTLSVTGIGFNISNIQVVATDKDIDFDYFKGLQSSFEDGLVTDENDENYGKYKVECKIVGKNKWHLGDLYFDTKTIKSEGVTPLFKKGVYTLSCNASIEGATIRFMNNSDKEINWISFNDRTLTLKEDIYTIHLYSTNWSADLSKGKFVTINNIQLEEGTQATSYEPYKESIHTLYLNSPLLKGDKLVVHDGKLCHYHKMGMVVLDGNNILPSNTNVVNGFLRIYMYKLDKKALYPGLNEYPNCYSNQLQTLTRNHWANFNIESVSISDTGQLTFGKKIDTLESFKQWLSKNPTTVVYELAEPYYEPIEPQLSSNSFSTVKDGDMEIITVLPIEKINLTYRTDINGVSSIEEQIASIQEGTDISSIIDEEVDE